MKTTLLGTCRLRVIKSLLDCTTIDEDVSYTHSTKEVLQLLKVLSGELKLPLDMMQYAFRTGIMNGRPVEIGQKIVDQFNNTQLFIIEICSIKCYTYKGVYLHHLAVDSRWDWNFWIRTPAHIKYDTRITEQTREEIEKDIEEIQRFLHGKKIVLVTHILPPSDKLQKRKYLIDILNEVCETRGLSIISPTENLVEDLVSHDLGHYLPEKEEQVVLPFFRRKLIELNILKQGQVL